MRNRRPNFPRWRKKIGKIQEVSVSDHNMELKAILKITYKVKIMYRLEVKL